MSLVLDNYTILEHSEYRITMNRKQDKILCNLWWDLKKYSDLQTGVIYKCPIDLTNAICCPYWILGIFKYRNFILISLRCNLKEKQVDFTFITEGDKKLITTVQGIKDVNYAGTYSGTINRIVIDSPWDLKMKLVVLCKVEMNLEDLKSVSFNNPVCFCSNMTDDLRILTLNPEFAIEVFFMAEALDTPNLKATCIDALKRSFSVQHFLRICSFSIRINDEDLIKKVKEFFMNHKYDLLKRCYRANSKKLLKPHWMNKEEHRILQEHMKELKRTT